MDLKLKEYDWSSLTEPLVATWEEWRCATVVSGVQYVMTIGTLQKLELPAGNGVNNDHHPLLILTTGYKQCYNKY